MVHLLTGYRPVSPDKEPSTTSLNGQDVTMTNEIATFDSSKTNSKKSAGWLTTNHITGEKSRVLLIPIVYKKRYAKVFDEKGLDCYFFHGLCHFLR